MTKPTLPRIDPSDSMSLILDLLRAKEGPCVSLYQPTHRSFPENNQDPLRYKNMLRDIEAALKQKYETQVIVSVLAPFQLLANDRKFWNHTLDGLAVLGRPGLFRVFRLQRPVKELHVVADTFHVKPLLRILQSADRYQILALRRDEIKLYEGNRDQLDEVDLAPSVPRTLSEMLHDKIPKPDQTPAIHPKGEELPMRFYTHGGDADILQPETGRWFRAVDQAIWENHSRPSGLPLLLASQPHNASHFRQISNNALLLPQGIDIHPDDLSVSELRERAWEVIQPYYFSRFTALVNEFEEAKSKGRGADELSRVAEAAVAGRIDTLLVEADRQVPGHADPDSGCLQFRELKDPGVDDLLDDLSQFVLKRGGKVVIAPTQRMPSKTGVAAIYRY